MSGNETEYEFSAEGISYMDTADVYEFNIEDESWVKQECNLNVQPDFAFHQHSSAYDTKRNRVIIYNSGPELFM